MAEDITATLHPLTLLGQVYVARLQSNRPALTENRQERQRLTRVENRLEEMTVTLRTILSEIKKKQK